VTTDVKLKRRYSKNAQNEVVRWLTQRIEGGTYVAGESIPSERKIADAVGVSRDTVRRAVARLCEAGLLTNRADGMKIVTVDASPSIGGIMQHTIVAMMHLPSRPKPGHQQPGWGENVGLGLQEEVQRAGYHILGLNLAGARWIDVREAVAGRPAGVIVDESFLKTDEAYTTLEFLREFGVPLVVLGNSNRVRRFDRVYFDHAAGARKLVEWLAAQGRRRIAFLGYHFDRELPWLHARRMGYEEGMANAGLAPTETIYIPELRGPGTETENFEANKYILAGALAPRFQSETPPDALLLPTDGVTHLCAAACRHLGKTPNEDVWIAGYDNYWRDTLEMRIEPFDPAATVDKRNAEAGRQLVHLLVERIREPAASSELRLVEPRLVIPDPEHGAA